MRCLNTKGKYGKVTNAEIKWSIISKSVMIVIFVEFIDQLIDYPINRASPSSIRCGTIIKSYCFFLRHALHVLMPEMDKIYTVDFRYLELAYLE